MAQAPSDDEELLRQLAKGNQAAFGAFYERYQGPIYRFAWHMSGNQGSAEEVVQEVFLRLIDNPRRYDPAKGSLAAYLFGMARNILRRQRSNEPELLLTEELLEGEDAAVSIDRDLALEIDRQEKLECLRRSVLALPAAYREALVLCDLEEMSYPDAAVVLGCPPGTVASRLHRARALLKLRLKGMGCAK